MSSHDPRVDAYIAKAAPFAQPILEHLRKVVHEACPEAEESLKWSMPFFSYKCALLCNMAAFKQHCSFGFWLHKDVVAEGGDEGMGQFGKITTLKDLPAKKTLAALVKKAMSLIDGGVKQKRTAPVKKPPAVIPEELAAAFAQRRHVASRKTFDGFPPGAQREYIDWINEAKTDATRQKRLATTLEWLAEGKRRNWKYESC